MLTVTASEKAIVGEFHVENVEVGAELRTSILLRIAKLCKKQGLFQLACKKYTQAGDKTKAMKTLLQSNDTEKIIFFAGTARQADVSATPSQRLEFLDSYVESYSAIM